MSWQLTNVKRTGRASLSPGAVSVRPTRLPLPSSSVKRYQYSVDGPEARGVEAAGPVRLRGDLDERARLDLLEVLIAGHFQEDRDACSRAIARLGLQPRPEDDAVRRGVAGGDALGIELAALGPRCSLSRGARYAERQGGTDGARGLEELAAATHAAHRASMCGAAVSFQRAVRRELLLVRPAVKVERLAPPKPAHVRNSRSWNFESCATRDR